MKYIKRIYEAYIRSRLFTECSEITVYNFMLCLEGNLKALIKKPLWLPGKAIIKKVWDELYLEYIDLITDPDKALRLTLIKQITQIESRRVLLHRLADYLQYNEADNSLVRLYAKMGYQLDVKNAKQSANRILIRFKTEEVKLKELKNQLEAMLDKDKKEAANKKTKIDYGSVFIEFSRYQNYHIKPKETTVAEFVHISNQYKAYHTKINENGKDRKFNR